MRQWELKLDKLIKARDKINKAYDLNKIFYSDWIKLINPLNDKINFIESYLINNI